MRLINPERLIEDKGFFIEDDQGRFMCVVSAEDIRDAQDAVIIWPSVPGNTDQNNTPEKAFHNGAEKFREKVIDRLMEMQATAARTSESLYLGRIAKMVGELE